MASPAAVRTGGARTEPAALTAAQRRVVAAAHDLFAEHGISGTSLQMIADALGVTKAAVYHQFKAKEDIVLAAAMSELRTLEDAIERAEAEPDQVWAREMLLRKVVDTLVERRRRVTLLQNDPVMVRLLAQHEPYRQIMQRLYVVLIGEGDADSRVQTAMVASALGAAVVHPLVAGLDDDELRKQMLHFAHRMLGWWPVEVT